MKQNQVVIIIAATIVLIVLASIFYFNKDISNKLSKQKNQQPSQSITPFDPSNISCPLSSIECQYAEIYTANRNKFNVSQLGFYNVASATPLLAAFDGVLEMNSFKLYNEKRVAITNGNYVAEYRFIGQFPGKLTQSVVKKGTVIGTSDQRLSFFDKKYNFIFSIWDKNTNKPIDIQFNNNKESIKIVK